MVSPNKMASSKSPPRWELDELPRHKHLIYIMLIIFVVGGLGFELCVFIAGWRHALRSEWPFIIIIIIMLIMLRVIAVIVLLVYHHPVKYIVGP